MEGAVMADKTVVIWDQIGQDDIKFAILDGDYSELDGVYINDAHQEQEDVDRLSDLIYDDNCKEIATFVDKFPVDLVKAGAVVIVAGFLP
jgi:hypothetical protein